MVAAKVKPKLTFRRIEQHLEEVYHRNFSMHDTVAQLCVARNLRHRSSSRYSKSLKSLVGVYGKAFAHIYNPD